MKDFISKIKFALCCIDLDLHYFLNRFDFGTIFAIMHVIGSIFLLIVVIHPEWFFQLIPVISITLSTFEFVFVTVFGSYILGLIIGLILVL